MDCGLEDLSFSGDAFTWKRGRIRERLDRGVANGGWSVMHPEASVQHLDYIKSDHRPIPVNTEANIQQRSSKKKRFEAKWMQEKGFHEKVQQTWEAVKNESPSETVMVKLNKLHGALHEWDANLLQNPKKRIKIAQRKLETAMCGPMNDDNEAVAKEMAELIDLLLEQEETHRMQRSRANWLKHGDHNTNFSHNYVSTRRKKNFIKKLKNDQNEWTEGTDQLKPLIFHYFSNLFLSEVNELDPAMMEKILPRVTDLMNEKLLAPFSPEDVKKAIFSIGDFKAPGPDGLHAVFYKKF
jgi:hypothetical protein